MKRNVKRHAVVQPQDQSTKLIPLTKGVSALVDAVDYSFLMQWNWYAVPKSAGFYAYRMDVRFHVSMHKQLTGNERTDHKNTNTLDNRRENLRACSVSQNGANRGKQINNKSGYKGVSWSKSNKGWIAQTKVHGKYIYLGTFTNREEAYSAYCGFVTKVRGEFARV